MKFHNNLDIDFPAGGVTSNNIVAQAFFDKTESWRHARTLAGEAPALALDNALSGQVSFPEYFGLFGDCGLASAGFLGYPLLQELAQNGLISAGVETLADEMCRRFVQLQGSQSLVESLDFELEKYEIQALFRQAAAKIGYYGGCLLYIDTSASPEDLKTPLILDPVTFPKNSLRGFVLIDPVNLYPGQYNASQPLRKDYFQPSTWYVMGQEVHASRFLYFSGQEAPLLFKPAYNFFGIPLAQLAWDYVLHFTQSREAAARLLKKFSLTAFKTNMSDALAGLGLNSLESRIQYFIEKQSNNGIFVLDKDLEDLVKLDTSLSGVTDIVGQALELLATVFRIPAVKYLGISPSGFNATGESDLRNFYDYCASSQAKQLSPNLKKVLNILQINKFGEIQPDLSFSWLALGDEDVLLQAQIAKTQAETKQISQN